MMRPAKEKARRLWQRPIRKEEEVSTTTMVVEFLVDSDGHRKPGVLRFVEPRQCPTCGRRS